MCLRHPPAPLPAPPPETHPRAFAETLPQDLALTTPPLGRRGNTVAASLAERTRVRGYHYRAAGRRATTARHPPPLAAGTASIPNLPRSERHLLVRQLNESTGPGVARQALNPMRGARGRVPRAGVLGPQRNTVRRAKAQKSARVSEKLVLAQNLFQIEFLILTLSSYNECMVWQYECSQCIYVEFIYILVSLYTCL